MIIWNLGTKEKLRVKRHTFINQTTETESVFEQEEIVFTEIIEGRGENAEKLDGKIWGAYIRSLEEPPFDDLADQAESYRKGPPINLSYAETE